jgi:hypothetical protein
VKTIIQEAIDAFEYEHLHACKTSDMAKCQRNHRQLIKRAQEYEASIERTIAADIAVRVAQVRDGWLDKPNIREGSYAAFIESVFGVAIKMLEEMK